MSALSLRRRIDGPGHDKTAAPVLYVFIKSSRLKNIFSPCCDAAHLLIAADSRGSGGSLCVIGQSEKQIAGKIHAESAGQIHAVFPNGKIQFVVQDIIQTKGAVQAFKKQRRAVF